MCAVFIFSSSTSPPPSIYRIGSPPSQQYLTQYLTPSCVICTILQYTHLSHHRLHNSYISHAIPSLSPYPILRLCNLLIIKNPPLFCSNFGVLGNMHSTAVLRIQLILMRIRIHPDPGILDPHWKKMDPDQNPGYFFKIY